ncbi:Serine/threonine-protein kinase [Actinidia chinensis var. chinensis]|uniref:Serine/threonine-protein kinase n=1 Tax=Actinidia chinensis var. chinensis TaxID=1590841 RepID=A0A2R6PYF5_ACTCC|nr:Serine/threonine-protein kinase [Actinidia chinensis var. chinensis]
MPLQSHPDSHNPPPPDPHDFPQTEELNCHTQDLPPDSFTISKEDEIDWFNQNAFFERKGSTKISNFNSNPHHSFQNFHNSPSQRSLLNSNSKASSIRFSNGNLRRSFKPESFELFRSRSEPGGKPGSEPGSPRVTCMGRVSSKKGREKRTGLWANLREVFRAGLGLNRVVVRKG